MIYRKHSKEKFWHRFPKDRTFVEKVARCFLIPKYEDSAFSWGGWDRYQRHMKHVAPFQWFISNNVPDLFRDWVVAPKNRIMQWVRYRTTERYHVLDLGLEPGYYDSDSRMMYAMFKILVDYVELDLASMFHVADIAEKNPGESSKKYYHRLKLFRKDARPDPKAGLAYLDWEINESAACSIPVGAGQQTQGDAAKEKKFLYLWWTKYRPARAALYSTPLIWQGNGYDPERPPFDQDCAYQYRLVGALEEFYLDEDEEMLHRLIKIRTKLWT